MLRYHSVQPSNVKATYTEFDLVDFEITFENRKMVANSLRIEGDVGFFTDNAAATRLTDQEVRIDQFAGAHSLFESLTTEVQTMGVLENFQEYPRYVRMAAEATMDKADLLNSENVCELRTASQDWNKSLLRGAALMNGDDNVAGADRFDLDFSLKPMIALNRVSSQAGGQPSISYTKTGAIRVSVKMARNANVMYGSGNAAAFAYIVKNLRLCFTSVPDDGKHDKLSMRSTLNIKQSISSSFANVSTKVPAVCTAVSCSFQQQSREGAIAYNAAQTEMLPDIQELQFIFNDAQDQYVTYQIRDRGEILDRYIASFANTGHNSAQLGKLQGNRGFGIGLAMGAAVDFSNQKFNVQITSGSSSGNPYIMYLYFHSVISM